MLTKRQIEVVTLVASDLQIKQVAERLGIAYKTADCHVYRAKAKLGISTAVGLTHWAIREGLVVA